MFKRVTQTSDEAIEGEESELEEVRDEPDEEEEETWSHDVGSAVQRVDSGVCQSQRHDSFANWLFAPSALN